MPSEIYLWGSGGGASEIRHLIDDLNQAGAEYVIKGIVGKGPRDGFDDLLDLPYIDTALAGWDSAVPCHALAVVTAGAPHLREVMWNEIETLKLDRPVLIHPTAVVPASARLAEGCVVGPNATISAAVNLAQNVYVSFNASAGHHSRLGAHSVLSPGARIGGEVMIGTHFFIGLGGVVVPRVKIGNGVSVSAGALVTGPLPDNSRVIAQKSRVLGNL